MKQIKNISEQIKTNLNGFLQQKTKYIILTTLILIVLAGVMLVSATQSTKMSLHGKATDTAGNPIDDGNLGVNISTSASCTSNVVFNEVYVNEIQDGIFDVLLGDSNSLNLNYNTDYYSCVYVNEELVSGPDKFIGGHGDISTDVTDELNTNRTGGKIYFTGDIGIGTASPNQMFHLKKTSGTARIKAENIGTLISDQSSLELNANSQPWQLFVKGNSDRLGVYRSPDEVMTFLAGGNIGIGVSNPSAKLEIDDAVESLLHIKNITETILYIDGLNGNVSIGKTTAEAKLDVEGNVQAKDFITASARDCKTNIQELGLSSYFEPLQAYSYNYKYTVPIYETQTITEGNETYKESVHIRDEERVREEISYGFMQDEAPEICRIGQGISYSCMTVILWEKIEELEARIRVLEGG